jgi:pilus assembly protein CpaF
MSTVLEIFDGLQGRTRLISLDRDEVFIGRDAAPPGQEEAAGRLWVELPGHAVSRRHLVLRRSGAAWNIVKIGRSVATLNDSPMRHNESVAFAPGDRIRLAEYDLVLRLDVEEAAPVPGEQGASLLASLEASIHARLLKDLDIARRASASGETSSHERLRIVAELGKLVSHAIGALGPDKLHGIARDALLQLLTMRITGAGAARTASAVDEDLRASAAAFHGDLAAVIEDFVRQLGLSLKPRDMEADCATLGGNFGPVFAGALLTARPGFWRLLCEYYLSRCVLNLMFGLGPLQDLLDMESISEIMVVSRNKVFVEKFGVLERAPVQFPSDEHVVAIIQRIASSAGRRIDKSAPMVDAHLADGSRINAVISPVALSGPTLTIRKFSKRRFTIEDFVRVGALSPTMRDFLRACVVGRKNVVVSGGTGSGKTTLLNCLSSFIPPKERVVTIEDTAELRMQQEHVVTLETRPPNIEGRGEITIRDLVKNALRMRPDRIVVGECRGAEAIDMLQAMNTGHSGSMTTAHANSPQELVQRLEVMVLSGTDMPVTAIRQQITAAVDIVVQLSRLNDGSRRVTSVAEVVGVDEASHEVPTFAVEMIEQGILDPVVFA